MYGSSYTVQIWLLVKKLLKNNFTALLQCILHHPQVYKSFTMNVLPAIVSAAPIFFREHSPEKKWEKKVVKGPLKNKINKNHI